MTMTFQAHEGHSARSEELHRHILHSHLAYLNQEETPSKLEQRRNLENLISSFVSVVSHSVKFTFLEVADVLSTSIESNLNFSAYKAGSAFEALEKYATNLISHPWRKEYKTVKLYSGFYKHLVESQLLGGSSVFNLLGYQFTEQGVLFLDEPIDPDKVARVALDCLTAYVECQIMVQICERIKSFKCSWQDIHNVRQDYVCGIDEAVRILHQLKRNALEEEKHERWLRNQENGVINDEPCKVDTSQNYQKTGILVDVSNTWPSNSFPLPSYSDKPVVHQTTLTEASYSNKSNKGMLLTHSKLPSWSESTSSQIGSYPSRNILSRSDESDGHDFTNHHHHHHPLDNQPHYRYFEASSNPSSQFVDSDLTPDSWKDAWDMGHSPVESFPERHPAYINCDRDGYNSVPNIKETYGSPFGHMFHPHPMMPMGIPPFPYPFPPHEFPPRPCPCRMCCEHQLSMLASKYNITKDGNCEPNNADNPSDVCSSFLKLSLDSHSSATKARSFPVNSPNFSTYQPRSEPDQPKSSARSKPDKRGSYYDNVPSTFENEIVPLDIAGPSLNPVCLNGSLTCNSASKQKNQKTTTSDSYGNSLPPKTSQKKQLPESTLELNHTTPKPTKTHLRDSKNAKKWSCTSCTFFNAPDKAICDMCGRSKVPGPENTPLVSGGRECPQCTLVNKKDSEDCTACGASLKDSPTYI